MEVVVVDCLGQIVSKVKINWETKEVKSESGIGYEVYTKEEEHEG